MIAPYPHWPSPLAIQLLRARCAFELDDPDAPRSAILCNLADCAIALGEMPPPAGERRRDALTRSAILIAALADLDRRARCPDCERAGRGRIAPPRLGMLRWYREESRRK